MCTIGQGVVFYSVRQIALSNKKFSEKGDIVAKTAELPYSGSSIKYTGVGVRIA
jgi:hypothetical protein